MSASKSAPYAGDDIYTFHLPVQLSVTAIEDMLGVVLARKGHNDPLSEYASISPTEYAVSKARSLTEMAKRRANLPYADLFGDPAWLILLDLFVRQHEGLQTSVSSACLGSYAPGTTALRYITEMTERNMLVRQADPDDQRRVYLVLADEVRETIIRLLQE